MLRITPLVNLKRIRKHFESLHEKVLVLRLQLSIRVSGNSRSRVLAADAALLAQQAAAASRRPEGSSSPT